MENALSPTGGKVKIGAVKAQKQIKRSQKKTRPRVQNPPKVNVEAPH